MRADPPKSFHSIKVAASCPFTRNLLRANNLPHT